jgi:hypothetical protein
MPNAQVCVYLMVHVTKLQLQTTFPKPLYIPHSTCIHGTLAAENLHVCTACDLCDSNIQLTMGKDRRRLLLPHLDLHLEVFVPKKKEIAENITAGSRNLKTQNLRTSGFHKRPGSFPGSYSTCSKQRDHPRPYTRGLFDHHAYISKPGYLLSW